MNDHRTNVVELHIDELVLDGVTADDRDVGAAVQREMTRLLGQRAFQAALSCGGTAATLNGGAIETSGDHTTGRNIANAVMKGIRG